MTYGQQQNKEYVCRAANDILPIIVLEGQQVVDFLCYDVPNP
jgi:uncharacterized protein YcgI (DUF1989 family)